MITQRTNEWYKARTGKFTASSFACLMTKPRDKSAKISKTALNCIEKLATELYLGEYHISPQREATSWGLRHEDKAIQEFSLKMKMDTCEMGFVQHPLINSVGATPDAKVIDTTRLEHLMIAQIKCPYNPEIHRKYLSKIYDTASLKKIASAYFWQMQGEMWVTESICNYFVSFDPRLIDSEDRLHIVKINRDEQAIKSLENAVNNAISLRNEILEDLKNKVRYPKLLSDYY